MDIRTLDNIYQDINRDYAEIAKAWKERLRLYGLIVEAMTELKCKTFSDLPQSVQNIIAIQMLALAPEEQLRSRLVVPQTITLIENWPTGVSESKFTPNSLRRVRHLPRPRRVPPRPRLLHLALLEGEHQRLLGGHPTLARGTWCVCSISRKGVLPQPLFLPKPHFTGARSDRNSCYRQWKTDTNAPCSSSMPATNSQCMSVCMRV